jgi:hypothetical protein
MVYPEFPELNNSLYHGSTVKVDQVELGFSASGKDFGRGFYTTTVRDQAAKFASIKAKRFNLKTGFVSVFRYIHKPRITIKNFDKADVEWLLFVLKNRGISQKRIAVRDAAFDIVIGPVANDAVGLVLNQLLIGTYGDPGSPDALSTAIRLLNTTRLYNQVFFGTKEAVSCLSFKEAFEVGIN